ncbi:MAG: tannase/feruloyl esterase family alpha/beta hydrolase [Acidobacteria bacterium]|nr:tannase/feruloyl esterase family alpha/beta hydrolase [Acidobacteriota bacterium]
MDLLLIGWLAATLNAADSELKPKMRCIDLRSLTGYEFSVISATAVPPSPEAPEYCRVAGQILPQVQFELALPASWGRRLYMFGNGGYAGESLDAPQRAGMRHRALRSGFAVTQTNTGHDAASEPLGTFATDRQKLLDYAFRSLHVTAETAKKIVRAYYGQPQEKAYFEGCSTGGRQGLILAQRFPEDFEGIVVGAPVLDFSGTMISYTWIARALAAAPIPLAKMKMLAERVYAKCDPVDGLADGLIEDPRRCDFSPSRDLPNCAAGVDGNDCFTAGQVAAIEKIYGDVAAGGQRRFPGWPVGAEIAPPGGQSGWNNWLVRDGDRTISVAFSETFFRYLAFPRKDPQFELSRFDFDKDPQRLAEIHQILDATDPDLSRFRARGGKIVMYFGWADQALNARMGVEYYETVRERMGASTPDFFRLFMVPGMFHCTGGVGVSSFDTLTPLRAWVEKGTAPDEIIGVRKTEGRIARTRPLCPYPQVAKYKGSGSIDDAANFACREP